MSRRAMLNKPVTYANVSARLLMFVVKGWHLINIKMKHARADYDRIQDPENKIGQDEPVFLLRAKDSLAPAMVENWASALQASGGDYKMVSMALEHAHKMREWQKENGCKLPDL